MRAGAGDLQRAGRAGLLSFSLAYHESERDTRRGAARAGLAPRLGTVSGGDRHAARSLGRLIPLGHDQTERSATDLVNNSALAMNQWCQTDATPQHLLAEREQHSYLQGYEHHSLRVAPWGDRSFGQRVSIKDTAAGNTFSMMAPPYFCPSPGCDIPRA